MSRRIVAYVGGTPQWADDGPGYARLQGLGGQLVVGASGLTRGEPLSDQAVKTKARRQLRAELGPEEYRARAAKGWAKRKGQTT